MTACVFDESAIFNKRKKVERMQQNSVEASRCLGRNSNHATCLSSFKWAMTYQRRRLPFSLTNTTLHNIRKLWCFTYILRSHLATQQRTDGDRPSQSGTLFYGAGSQVAAPSSWTRQATRTQAMGPCCLESKRRVRSSEGEGSP